MDITEGLDERDLDLIEEISQTIDLNQEFAPDKRKLGIAMTYRKRALSSPPKKLPQWKVENARRNGYFRHYSPEKDIS
jgi:hypothetical protein